MAKMVGSPEKIIDGEGKKKQHVLKEEEEEYAENEMSEGN